MRISLTHRLVDGRINESSAFTLVARFWDDAADEWVADAPTTARYRIDDPVDNVELLAWTTLTPATSIDIAITATDNAIRDNCSLEERRQITVQADAGLSTQYQETKLWRVANLAGQT